MGITADGIIHPDERTALIDWVEYEDKSQAGQVAGYMFQDVDKIYFSFDH
jgi:hypothetical protein